MVFIEPGYFAYSFKESNTDDAYWRQVGNVVEQIKGLSDGYNSSCPENQVFWNIRF
jgi:hypothetical protein